MPWSADRGQLTLFIRLVLNYGLSSSCLVSSEKIL